MDQEPDQDGLRLRRAIRKEIAFRKRSTQERLSGLSPEAARARLVLRRKAWAAALREGRESLTAMEAELDRMVRFGDLFTALVLKPKR